MLQRMMPVRASISTHYKAGRTQFVDEELD